MNNQPESPTPESLAEKYIADMVSSAPEPLRELGDYLSRVLDEDEFKTAERYLLGAMNADAKAEPQWQEALELMRWARGKLFRIEWTRQADAHMMDRLNDAVSEDERD